MFAKVVSVLLATLFFFIYRGLDSEQISFSLPIQLTLPEDVVVLEQDASTVKVTLKGRRADIAQFERRNIALSLIIDEFKEGEHSYPIQLAPTVQRHYLKDLRLYLEPATVQIRLEPIIDKLIPIEPVLLGQPAKGFMQSKLILEPDSVIAKGPRSMLERINIIRTQPIDISNQVKSLQTTIDLHINQPKIELSHYQTMLTVEIISQFQFKRTLEIPLTLLNLAEHLELEDINLFYGKITIESKVNNFDAINPNVLSLKLNMEQITQAGLYNLRPELNNLAQLPDDYNIIVNQITIKIKEKES
ncbi:YbbR-like domain-containing protein [Entomospira culicis]|uniref:YbbR-like protein n=1 Tax=Entomospira culicis TaxID=2719989 RepID=A0A968KVF9_9SPIO|nr:CdaR family protein [Entomospira culicis]NIZ18853.1 hypothetical protein [Entomospira culicis]NIZ69068.1 hypothetical protein [Entomospira culicis]WDI37655.1 CdaR family protein [Entomospira culicis]WDI39283.1 CdaR family protein [Entomospira culicis]